MAPWTLFRRPRPTKKRRRTPLTVELLEGRAVPSATTLPDGIASGDTTATSTVLWAHATVRGPVYFAYASDAAFHHVLGGRVAIVTDPTQPVKVSVTGLTPHTDYYYQAIDTAGDSAAGHFRTAAAPGEHDGLTFGVGGDWEGGLSPYPSISNAAGQNLDFFLEHSDTVYADVPSPALGYPAQSLADFRTKHNEVYAARDGVDNWANLRASTSVLATLDDHEVIDNFAGGAPPSSDPRFDQTGNYINETQLYKNGVQAFQEYNPLQNLYYGNTGDPRTAFKPDVARYDTYGQDAFVAVLDGRSFRDALLPDVTNLSDPAQVGNFLVNAFNPNRTLLGHQQLADVEAGLLKAQQDGVTWKFVAVPNPVQNFGILLAADRYEGYAAERAQLLGFIANHHIENVVFVTADLHGYSVNNLDYQTAPFGPELHSGAFEVMVPGVGNQFPLGPGIAQAAAASGLITPPQYAYYNSLPIAGKDQFVEQLITQSQQALGYDPIGLDGSDINAQLLQGTYFAAHQFGWTQFSIDPKTQQLTVTTYGVGLYDAATLQSNPAAVLGEQPTIISKFVVTPQHTLTTLTGTAIDDGSAQRSMVRSATLNFSALVTLDAGAITLTRDGGGSVPFVLHQSAVDGRSVVQLTFGGSLADGRYTLTVHGDKIHDRYGYALDGDGNGTAGGDAVVHFFRLFGDADGNGVVDGDDAGRFMASFGKHRGQAGYLDYFDANADGVIDLTDFRAFVLNYGHHV